MQNSIGKELKIIRIRNNLRLEDVADNLNINKETLRRYENNSNGLSVERLEQLLDFYKIDKSIFLKMYVQICTTTILKKKRSKYGRFSKTIL